MKIKRIMLAALLLAILTMGAVSADDGNATSDNLAASEDLIIESSVDDEILSTGEGTFSDLSTAINSTAENAVLQLDKDYKNDGSLSDRITVSKAMTIDGKGHEIDANSKSGMFKLGSDNIALRNIKFVNANSKAITVSGSNCSIINCSFNNCSPVNCSDYSIGGGVISMNSGRIVDCSFIDCVNGIKKTIYGGVVSGNSDIINCRFVNCSNNCDLVYGGAVSPDSSRIINSTFSNCGQSCNTVYGGAIEGDGSIINCTFTDSRIEGLYFSYVQITGKSNITNCIFTDCLTGVCCNYGCVANITNCSFAGCLNGAIGFWCEGGNVTDCTFTDTSSTAIHVSDSYVNIVGCNFRNCSSEDDGGAINICERYDNIIDCIFINCSASRGGAIYIEDHTNKVINCSFVNCSAENGGSVYWNGKNGTLIDSYFEDSSASENGGAIYWCGENGNIDNSDFVDSIAAEGRAIYVSSDNVTVSNSRFESDFSHDIVCGGIISNCTLNGIGSVRNPAADDTFYGIRDLINEAGKGGVVELDKDYVNDGSYGKMRIGVLKEVTIDGNGHKIDANSKSGLFEFNTNNIVLKNIRFANAIIEAIYAESTNCSIINCSFENCSPVNSSEEYSIGGGVIYMKSGRITDSSFINCIHNIQKTLYGGVVSIYEGEITNCSFFNCTYDCDLVYGGAISPEDTRIINCTFSHCADKCNTVYGSAIEGSATVVGCTFSNNCIGSDDPYGGEVHFTGPSNISDSIFIDCASGVCCNYGCIANITNCTFIGCSRTAINFQCKGGNVTNCTFRDCNSVSAIFISDYHKIIIAGCIFTNCSSKENGGAIYNCAHDFEFFSDIENPKEYENGSGAHIINSSFIKCSAVTYGGGIFFEDKSEGSVTDSTFDECSAGENGGAIYVGNGADVKIKSSNFEKNYARSLAGAVYGGDVSDCNFTKNSVPETFDSNKTRQETRTDVSVNPGDAQLGDKITISAKVYNENDAVINGNVDLYIESDFIATVKIGEKFTYTANKTGNFEIKARYLGDENYLESESYDYVTVEGDNPSDVVGDYDISDTIPDELTSMDDGVVVLEFPDDATGTVEVFVNGTLEMVVRISNGIARIDLSKYKGDYDFSFKYSGDEVYAAFTKDLHINVQVKVSKIVADNLNVLYSSGGKYSVKVYDGEGKLANGVKITFLINSKSYKTAVANNGVASIEIDKVPGSYKITSKFLSVSVTKTLTVKHVVTLKKATVKKSAKKLVLTATLAKVNKKYLKNKKVTFKFNGKKYTAKTNKKGVAKVTIKSSVLKKLKVGKKVTYQATYLKDTVKKTVKVKK